MPHQQIWTCAFFGRRRLTGFTEHIVPNNGFAVFLWHARNRLATRISTTVHLLDLGIVSHCIHKQVVFNQPADKGRAIALPVSEVHTGSGTDDFTVADNPVPGWPKSSDTVCQLSSSMAHNLQAIQRDVMRYTACLNCINIFHIKPINF